MSNLSVIADHMNLLRSDHSQFWIINNKEYFASLPAILLSDLGDPTQMKLSEVVVAKNLMSFIARPVPRPHALMLPSAVRQPPGTSDQLDLLHPHRPGAHR